MKLFKLVVLVFPLMFLSACETLQQKDEQAGAKDVIVEERGTGETGGYGTEIKVVADEEQFAGQDLKDPASLPSNRVVYFAYDSASVRMEDQQTLEAHAAYLGIHPDVTVRLEGHTDERGSREYNLALGERRALSIRQILMLQGASINQFQISSFGEERPVAEGSDEVAWAENRRVEIIYPGQ